MYACSFVISSFCLILVVNDLFNAGPLGIPLCLCVSLSMFGDCDLEGRFARLNLLGRIGSREERDAEDVSPRFGCDGGASWKLAPF